MAESKIEIVVPQLGEGLREVLIVQVYKKPGESVKQGDALYQVETEKAVSDVEASTSGVLESWSIEEGMIVQIGQCVGMISTSDVSSTLSSGEIDAEQPTEKVETFSVTTQAQSLVRNAAMAPRTRKILEEHGLFDQAPLIPRKGSKLVPDDVIAFLKQTQATPSGKQDVQDPKLSTAQRAELFRLEQGARRCVPATLTMRVGWTSIESALTQLNLTGPNANLDANLATTLMMSWCIGQAALKHPFMRSRIERGPRRTTSESVHVGIAVQTTEGEFRVASTTLYNGLSWEKYRRKASKHIRAAEAGPVQKGPDQAGAEVHLVLSNMMPYQVHNAVPTVVAPSVATLFVGQVHLVSAGSSEEVSFHRMFNVSMTFDHRIANGIEAARFLQSVKNCMEQFSLSEESLN